MNERKTKIGTVVSNKMQKSVSVEIERLTLDTRFKKYIRRKKKFLAHDENGECKIGDKVEIRESRPLSKLKRWRVIKIVEKAPIV
ncbi:MAG: 30S ribosomal protein S17 [Deltaproteobacteria bacterium CG_4_10_14_0_2_um_filter_43_8]|nr:MAG: 30S ribosomal protein S17 [Deltaproteobacteria bacterium CG11_big_fil_rev_8_21_14_0_20_42_23]PJA21600.1 MAG: 30S ribosomal protein S17 [Deltaproteobacteria bacterium CG_4_10_14_0_2_um_filter_43_8]PJC64628.1 MAG: 30S ribosomal protein S17 [Deltaproteobacteria bacterium CG_4_9_14_0_2_um_filter_42_21]